ncbi:hypothetical protein [Streptomyces coeruleofuscus]|uniref:hypothetical protein n=1 Tax=Streptomyces coeruleofuscus TaxID=66879 RepID=UPI0031FA2DCB
MGDWLCADRFPQRIDLLLALVRAVQAEIESSGLVGDPTVVRLLDPQRWRAAYQAEAARRADSSRVTAVTAQGTAALERMRPGRPLSEVTDPFHLEVHRAIASSVAGLPPLPRYVPREHDRQLAQVVTRAAGGASQIAVLVGGSSTGKTRACWQALELLRARHEPWRLWHPIDPTRPDAALAELADISSYTVIWLNEAQLYLAPDGLGERISAGLRNLLREPERGPVLVLATLWPKHWKALTTSENPDTPTQASELLDGHKIKVPDSFTASDLATLSSGDDQDPRLGEAAEYARDGQIAQYLAGVPALLDRYQEAEPATKAVIHAAMDARALGAGPRLPLALLTDAAPGYLTDTEWDQADDDWLERALRYVTTPCKGIPGIFTTAKPPAHRNERIRPTSPLPGSGPGTGDGPLYRLADYLDQHGWRYRTDQVPPIAFWTACAAHAHPADLTALGNSAWAQGMYRDAVQLHKRATAHGSPHSAAVLVRNLHELHPADLRPAQWAAAHAALDDPTAVARLLSQLQKVGGPSSVRVLLNRNPAAHVGLDDLDAVGALLHQLHNASADEQLVALADRVADHGPLNDPSAVVRLLDRLQEVGTLSRVSVLLGRNLAAQVALDNLAAIDGLLHRLHRSAAIEEFAEQAAVLGERVAADAALDDVASVTRLLKRLRTAKALEQFAALADRAAAQADLDDLTVVLETIQSLLELGAQMQAGALAHRGALHSPLHDPYAVARLLGRLRQLEAHADVFAVLDRNPAGCASLDDLAAVAWLLDGLYGAGAVGQSVLLADRAAAHGAVDDLGAVARTVQALHQAGLREQATALVERACLHVRVDDSYAVIWLLGELRKEEALEQFTALAHRVAAHIALDDCGVVVQTLDGLQKTGAHEQAAALAQRAANHLPLNDPYDVSVLLDKLWSTGAYKQAAALAERSASHAASNGLHLNPSGVPALLDKLREIGAHKQAVMLARRVAAQTDLDEPHLIAELLDKLQEMGAHEQAATLSQRAASCSPLTAPHAVAQLLGSLRKIDARDQIDVLLKRNPAGLVGLGDVYQLPGLLQELNEVGACEQSAALAQRIAAYAAFDIPGDVVWLLDELPLAGAHEQATALAQKVPEYVDFGDSTQIPEVLARLRGLGALEQAVALANQLPPAGRFDDFLQISDHRRRFRFGREPDGNATAPWTWDDLA